MSVIKQYVILRRDLLMSPGLACAQAAHLSSLWVYKRFSGAAKHKGSFRIINTTETERVWMPAPTMGVKAVNTPEELEYVIAALKALPGQPPFEVWKDTIKSEILDRHLECVVGVAVGPFDDEILKQVVGPLPLY